MHIIVFAHRLATPRSVTLTARHLMIASVVALCTMVAGTALLYYLSLRYASSVKVPLLDSMLRSVQADSARKNEEFLRQNLNAMAVKLGEMQAQLMRLDALGERVSGLAGVKPQEFRSAEPPGRGGAVTSQMRDLSMVDFAHELDKLARGLESRADYLNVAESELFNAKLKAKRLPTALPVNAEYNASGFGQRIDPITGQSAMHEGIDFIAQPGAPVAAAAGGVVIAAEWHHSFGNMIEIDHGGDIVTRYAHNSVMLIKPGDIVKRGQKIAEVGSTGRSTGPHLHFEVRYKGQPQNPAKFLQAAQPVPGQSLAQSIAATAMEQAGSSVVSKQYAKSAP
jgi:murein DD-endopeptidase MepM/ murein hydrolase activator NlpD